MSLGSLLRCLADKLDECCSGGPRVIMISGPVGEQSGPVAPTPQYFQWPLIGECIYMRELTDNQFTFVRPKFVTAKGNPAPVDGAPQWFVDNPNVLALAPDADGMACKVSAVGPLGTARVSVKADADMGAGVVEIAGFEDYLVKAGAAVTVVLQSDEPSEQPPVTP